MNNRSRKIFLRALCFVLILGASLVSTAVNSENPSSVTLRKVIESQVDSIIKDYMTLREYSVVSAETITSMDTTKSRLSGRVDTELLLKEAARKRGHALAAKNAGIVVFDSKTEILNRTEDLDEDTIKVLLYELTTCSYRSVNESEGDPFNTFAFGLWHDMAFSQVDGRWVLVQDNYDEPDIADPDNIFIFQRTAE